MLIKNVVFLGFSFVLMSLLAHGQDEGLVLSLDFEGEAIEDNSSYGHVIIDHQTMFGTDVNQNGLLFNGQNAYLEVPPVSSLEIPDEITMSLWYRYESQESAGSFYSLIEQSADEFDGHSRYGIWLRGNEELWVCIEPDVCESGGGLCQRCASTAITLKEGEWYHVAGTYNGTQLKLYLDGRVLVQREYAFETGISVREYPLTFGTDIYDFSQVFLKGALDEVRLYNRSMSGSEITSLFEEFSDIKTQDSEEPLVTHLDHSVNGSQLVYPNPASGVINIRSSVRVSSVSLFDFQGKELYKRYGDNNRFDVSDVKEGLYLLKFLMGNKTHYMKLVISD